MFLPICVYEKDTDRKEHELIKKMSLLEQKSHLLLGLLFEIRNRMGAGWSEDNYHKACEKIFLANKIPFVSKPRFPLFHRGFEIYRFEPDMLLWDEIILELKVLPQFKEESFPSINVAQLIQYLKRCEKELGFLVNFAHSKVGFKRMVYQPQKIEINEDYEHIKGVLTLEDRSLLIKIRKHLLSIVDQYGIGYSDTIYRNIVQVEFGCHGLNCQNDLVVDATWNGEKIGSNSVKHLLVEDNILLLVKANIKHGSVLNFTSTKSYLKSLGLKIGIIINFGRNSVQINGISV